MQVDYGLKQFYMLKIKHKHISYFKQYLALETCPSNPYNCNDMKILEITAIKSPSPQQARIDGLKRQKEIVSKQLKAERDRQRVAKAQQQIQAVRNNATVP
jgi:hypothetical protein